MPPQVAEDRYNTDLRIVKIIKRLLWIIGGGLLLLFLFGFLMVEHLKPDYSGEMEISGLKGEVSVYFDPYGIPHIYAQNDADAFRALGFVHAQDRLWQMELLRRVAAGGLSEVFGAELLPTDRLFLSLGIDEATTRTLDSLNMDSRAVQLAQAYLDGINHFVAEGPTPPEFYLTGIDKKPFSLRDIHNTIGYMAFTFAMAHKTDPLLSEIQERLGPAYLSDLEIDLDTATARIPGYEQKVVQSLDSDLITSIEQALEKLPVPQFIGSNSWVLAPQKTRSGKVILANDPHIGFSQPAVWYEAHISTPTYEKYGYHLAGVPFPLLGHNRRLAYGLTMFENDDVDFYREELHPEDSTLYKFEDGYEPFRYSEYSIAVKDSQDVIIKVRSTQHGPVMNAVDKNMGEGAPVSMKWLYTHRQNKLLSVLYGMGFATNLEEFRAYLPDLHAPGLNVMYGDAEGNIAWWATAKLYQMPDSVNTKLILDGASGRDEMLRYLDFSENPKAVNPPWNYVYSANNQPGLVKGKPYPGYYLPENRALRIVQKLESRKDWDMASVGEMMLDDTSAVNPSVITDLAKSLDLKAMNDRQLMDLDLLNTWKGNYSLNSIPAGIYHRWIYYYLKGTFEDELGAESFERLLNTHLIKRMIAPMAAKDQSVWWDDITTSNVETKGEIVKTAFDKALASLEAEFGTDRSQWTWDRFHKLEHPHPIGRVEQLRDFFNVGPYAVGGSREVINNMAFPYGLENFNVTAGPSTRRVVDFSDIENSLSILPTGQSGNPFSKHYRDQSELFVQGKYRKMMLNEEEIKETSESLLVLQPAD